MRLIDNLASSNISKNTEYDRKKSAYNLDKGKMAEVKAKLDLVHNLMKKQIRFVKGVEVVEVTVDD